MTRRQFLHTGAVAMIGAELSGGGAHASDDAQGRRESSPQLTGVKALVFDVFGTVVDWRSSVTREIEELARRKGLKVDGPKFADRWRAGYGPSMNRVRSGELPWTTLDRLHRMILDTILVEFAITGLSD